MVHTEYNDSPFTWRRWSIDKHFNRTSIGLGYLLKGYLWAVVSIDLLVDNTNRASSQGVSFHTDNRTQPKWNGALNVKLINISGEITGIEKEF